MVTRHWLPKIVRPISIFRAIILLRIIAGTPQIVIKYTRENFIADDRFNRRQPHVNLSPWMMRRINDRFRSDLRLINWRHWLRLARKPAFHPTKLRRVQRGHLNHRHAHFAFVVDQFASERIDETLHGMFGRAVRCLQRDAAVSKRRAHLNDDALVSRQHIF